MQFSWKNPLSALPVLLLLAAYAGAAFGAAGNVQFVIGDAKLITRAGETRALQKGAEINEGDRIVTAAGASVQIKMADGGFIAVRPGTDMSFDTYRYSGKEDGTESAVVSLLQGGFRTITGLIGRTNKQNYMVKTATATIGIRGTDHEPMVILAPLPGQVAIAEPGTYDKVNVGIAYIRTDAGSVDIHRNQVGFAPVSKAAPVLLPKIPPFYKPTPAPGPQKAASPAEKAAEASTPIRETAVVDPTGTVTAAPAATVTAVAPAAVAPVVPIALTDASGATLNLTTQTQTTSSGITSPITTAPIPEATSAQAQTAADAAAKSAADLTTLLATAGAAATGTLPVAISTASPVVSAAASAVSSASSVTISSPATASSNAASLAAQAQTAATQASTLPVSSSVVTSAVSTINSNLPLVQSAAANVAAQASALPGLLTSAASAALAMNASITTANNALSTLTGQELSQSTTAQSQVAVAQSAVIAAQAAAALAKSLQNSGDLTGAQAQLGIAQQQQQVAAKALSVAQTIINGINAAGLAQSKAGISSDTTGTAFGFANAAQAAVSSAAASLAQTDSTVTTSAANLVKTNAVLIANIGTSQFGVLAQTAADQAGASASALNTLLTSVSASADPTAASTTASSAVSAAQLAVSSASTAATGIAALTINTGLAASNVAAAAALATTATTQVSTATTKFTANGSFADAAIAVPAIAALNTASAALQTANGGVQSAAGTATAQSTTLASAQSTVSPALSLANQALAAANTALSALTAAGVATTTASNLLSEAQTAAGSATAAAHTATTLQSAGDFTGAQAQSATAQQQAQTAANALVNATQIITAVVNADTAQLIATSITAASTGILSAATSAQSAGAGAVNTTSTQLAAAQAQAQIVQANSVLAQYSNPAMASGNFDQGLLGMKPVTGGVEQTVYGSPTTSANTNYVLDGNKSLVEIRNIGYERFGLNYSFGLSNRQNFGADVTFSGGVAKDLASDPNGVYYFGRWQGGQVNVTDLAPSEALLPFSDNLGLTSLHWIVGLVPGNSSTLPGTTLGPINNTQQVIGTASYSLAAATHPTDSFGNVGTLNSATLAANFSTQTVNAAVGLSFSSTDPVNVSTRNFNIDASAVNVPIQKSGFDAFAGAPYAPSIQCRSTSGDCAAVGYVGNISGAFLSTASAGTSTGAVGTGAAMGYSFTPNIVPSQPNQPFTDLIQGLGVLSTSAAPTVGVTNFSSTAVLRDELLWSTTQVAPGVNPTTTTYLVSDKNKESLINNLGATPTSPVILTGPTNNTNFLFDASGNLVRVFDTPHVVFDLSADVPGTSTQFAAPTPLAHAQLSFGGGATTSESYFDPGTNVRFGRWTGGVVNVTDLTTGNSYVESLVLPDGAKQSVQWIVAQSPSSLPLTGEFHYTRINGTSGTAPTDSYGNIGTLEGARLSADFTNMTASAGVRISIPSGSAGSFGMQNLSAHFENAPILNGGFNVGSSGNLPGTDNLHVNCFGFGCAPDIALGVSAYGGRIRGAFDSATGNAGTADGAFLRYTFDTFYGLNGLAPAGRLVDDYINGLVAFQQGPQIVLPTAASGVYSLTAPTAPVTVLTTYSYNNGGNSNTTNQRNWVDHPSPANLTLDTLGNLVSIADDNNQHGNGNAIALNGGTPTAPISLAIGNSTPTVNTAGVTTVVGATDGTILLGWQAPTGTTALTVSGTDSNNCFGTTGCANTARTVLGDGLAWVRGPAPFPDYLPGAIAGFTNSTGVVVPATATYNLGASILHDQNGVASTAAVAATLGVNFNTASVNFGMTATTGAGIWNANANGIRLDEAGGFNAFTHGGTITTIPTTPTGGNVDTHDNLTVTLNGSSTNTFGDIQGQLMGIGLGGAGVTYNLNSFLPCTIGPCSNVTASGALAFGLSPGQQPYSTLTAYQVVAFATGMNAAGQFDSSQNYAIKGGFVSPNRTQTVNDFPVKVDSKFPLVVTQTSTCGTGCNNVNVNDIPVVYAVTGAIGPASIGNAILLESGIDAATGMRWGRYGNGTIGVTDRITGASLGTVDVTQQNAHFIMSSVQSGPTVLPLTGTLNYTFAGGTSPTDSNGKVGLPLTSANASLTANFSTQTVNATLSNLVLGGNTWGASATGIPIVGNVFQAEQKLGGGGNMAVTFNGATGANAGQVAGVFTGATGNGVGMLYSLNHGGNNLINANAVTVSGVAAFRR